MISTLLVTIGCLAGSPVFAAPAQSSIKAQSQQFHRVLDAYESANTELRERISTHSSLNEQVKAHLLSLMKSEQSELLTLRSKLWSTTDAKTLKSLAANAKVKRVKMKSQEQRLVMPVLELTELRTSLLPTALERLQDLDEKVTKRQHDQLAEILATIERDAVKLEAQLISAKPPMDAPAQVRKLQTQLKGYYSTLRKIVK